MVSKLWRALESPGELVKNTDDLTSTYRLGLSRSGRGRGICIFNKLPGDSHAVKVGESPAQLSPWCSLQKKSFKSSSLPPISSSLQGLACSCPGLPFNLASLSTSAWTPCRILTARVFPCKPFTSLPPNLFELFPGPWMFCLLHFHQSLWRAGVEALAGRRVTRLGAMHHGTRCKHPGMGIQATKKGYLHWHRINAHSFLKMTLGNANSPKVAQQHRERCS